MQTHFVLCLLSAELLDLHVQNLHGWEKAVIACMCLALIAELVAVAWTVVTLCACCCKSFILHPLPLLATIVAVFLTVAVAVYGANNRDALSECVCLFV